MANEIELNGLADINSLPDDWKISLINPDASQPAQNIKVARFIELLPFLLKLGGVMDSALQVRVGLSGDALIEDTIGLIHFGSMPSSGLPYMSYGLKYKNNENKIISTWDASRIAYFMYIFNSDGLYYGVVDEGIKPIGTEVSISFHKITNSVSSYSLSKNALTEPITLNNSILPPPPRKLRAKPLYYRQFYRTICGGRCIGYRPGWFNSS